MHRLAVFHQLADELFAPPWLQWSSGPLLSRTAGTDLKGLDADAALPFSKRSGDELWVIIRCPSDKQIAVERGDGSNLRFCVGVEVG